MVVTELITNNIKDTKLTNYLSNKGIIRNEADKGMHLHLWLSKIINEGRISVDEINQCLYKELMYGKRRLMRHYELKNIRKIKRENDWQNFLSQYNCTSLNFNNILQTHPDNTDKIKVCAISTKISNETIQKVDILFVYNMKIRNHETEGETYFYSYLPVTFDLIDKSLTIKVWNKEDSLDNDSPSEQLYYVYTELQSYINFECQPITINPQSVLYKMSKALFDDFFKQLPNINEIEAKKEFIPSIVNSLLSNISLQNSEYKNGELSMNPEVINTEDEMYKLLQQVALYDYLKDNKIQSLLKNTDKYISKIRFNDRDNLTASLTSEKGVKCIFDAKTFMCVRNSLDIVETIVSIVVSFVKDKGLLSVKYDASDKQFLNIHILNDRYYSEEDYKKIWELYKLYESEYNNAIAGAVYTQDNTTAM